jgi:basic amino acid/polyamine antiporter, APA family
VLACGGVAAALTDTVLASVPALALPGVRQAIILAVLAAMTIINLIGVDLAAKVLGWATLVKVLPLLLFLIIGGIALAGGQHAATPIVHSPTNSFGRALILAVFAFTGMETPLAASGEVRDPARTVPRALLLAMGSIGLLYVAVQVVAQALLGAGLLGSHAPLADALATVDVRLRAPLLAAAMFSMLIWLGSDFLGAPRILFGLARDGLLPAVLGRVHPRWRTPYWGIVTHFVIAAGLALSGTLAIAPLYVGIALSAVRLRQRDVAILGRPVRIAGLPLIAGVAVLSMVVLVALAEWREIAGLVAVMVGSAFLYLIVRWKG